METIFHLDSDIILKEANDSLLREWEAELGYKEGSFAKDGFFPCYTEKGGMKILFIGREALEIDDCIGYMYEAFQDGKTSDATRGFTTFYRRLLKFAYGLMVGVDSFEDIPDARVIGGGMAADGLSFAFANLSKVPNARENGDWKVGKEFHEFNSVENLPINRKYWQKQIELLHPDIIISFGLERYLHFDYGEHTCLFGHMDVKQKGELCNTAILTTDGGYKCYYIDPQPHLSATTWNKHGLTDEYFFNQLNKAVDYALDHPLATQDLCITGDAIS